MSDDMPIVLVGKKIETSLWDYSWGDEAQANARLIAAAPELLEACQKARAWMGERPSEADQRWPHGKSVAEVIDALDAAIAKATGASNDHSR